MNWIEVNAKMRREKSRKNGGLFFIWATLRSGWASADKVHWLILKHTPWFSRFFLFTSKIVYYVFHFLNTLVCKWLLIKFSLTTLLLTIIIVSCLIRCQFLSMLTSWIKFYTVNWRFQWHCWNLIKAHKKEREVTKSLN